MGYKMKNKENSVVDYKKIGIIFFQDFKQARFNSDQLKVYCNSCDQLNVVIEQEGDMDDSSLLSLHPKIKVYAGEAWTVIHRRRIDEGWYSKSLIFK